MDVLWDRGASTIRDVIEHLSTDPAYTTIATVLGNLEKKGLVSSRRRGRSAYYRARRSRVHHVAAVMSHALDSTPDRAASIHHFVDSMPTRDREMLREYLARGAREEDV